MERIEIEYSDEANAYFYTCPYCHKRAFISGPNNTFGCEHVIYAYETINSQLIISEDSTIVLARSILSQKPIEFLESFEDFWNDNCEDYFELDDNSQDAVEFDPMIHATVIDDYLESSMSVDDLIDLISESEHKDQLNNMTVAELVDLDMAGGTFYILHRKGHL